MEYACETDSTAALGEAHGDNSQGRTECRVRSVDGEVAHVRRDVPPIVSRRRRTMSRAGRRRCQSANQERSHVSQLLPDSMRATRYWEPTRVTAERSRVHCGKARATPGRRRVYHWERAVRAGQTARQRWEAQPDVGVDAPTPPHLHPCVTPNVYAGGRRRWTE
ncbi:hypothetical protein K466DRAFT_387384 [Polyporus arcularius HHB13444]|uniref:Uncharacterized protein n=1 Tax=Polyporus arcularius HHB13444 TaxID=1314778 RepID=A0A5C3NS97_9APHY|nr:hypothetical protein K466DRAFT_387384 [Polyporus arcularius HHB13444]